MEPDLNSIENASSENKQRRARHAAPLSVLSLGNDCRIVRRVQPFNIDLKLCAHARRSLQRQS